jgi:hypothetical protein
MIQIEKSFIIHPTLGKIQFIPNNTQRLIFSHFEESKENENIIFLSERQKGTSVATAALAVHLGNVIPQNNVAIITSNPHSLSSMRKKIINIGNIEDMDNNIVKNTTTIILPNKSQINLLHTGCFMDLIRGYRYDTIFFDNSVPSPELHFCTKRKIFFITHEFDKNLWFNFGKLPTGNYKLIKL